MSRSSRLLTAALAATLTLGLGVSGAAADSASLGSYFKKFDPPAGQAQLSPMTPPWCSRTSEYRGKNVGSALGRALGAIKDRGWTDAWIADAAAMLCAHPEAPDYRRQTAQMVQGYMAFTGLSRPDAARAIGARVDEKAWKAQRDKTCAGLSVDDEASKGDQLTNDAMRALFGCGRSGPAWEARRQDPGDLVWYLDRRAEAPELLRLYWAIACLKAPWYNDAKSGHDLARYAYCGPDARRLSRERIDRELAAAHANERARTLALETLAVVGRSVKKLDAAAKAKPGLKKVLVEAPEAAWRAWQASYRSEKSGIEAALAFEAKFFGPSLEAARGCTEPLRQAFAHHLDGAKGKAGFDARAGDPVGSALLLAVANCAGVEGGGAETYALVELWESLRLGRGPRYAAYHAALDALSEIRADRPRFFLEPEMFTELPVISPRKTAIERMQKRIKYLPLEPGSAVVARVKKVSGGVRVEFKTEKWKEDVVECHDTNKVWRIGSGGDVKYFRRCKTTGRRTVRHTALPVVVPAYAAANIRRGALVEFSALDPLVAAGKARPGFPLAVWKSKAKKRLVAAYGFSIK